MRMRRQLQIYLTHSILQFCEKEELFSNDLTIQATICLSGDSSSILVAQICETVSTEKQGKQLANTPRVPRVESSKQNIITSDSNLNHITDKTASDQHSLSQQSDFNQSSVSQSQQSTHKQSAVPSHREHINFNQSPSVTVKTNQSTSNNQSGTSSQVKHDKLVCDGQSSASSHTAHGVDIEAEGVSSNSNEVCVIDSDDNGGDEDNDKSASKQDDAWSYSRNSDTGLAGDSVGGDGAGGNREDILADAHVVLEDIECFEQQRRLDPSVDIKPDVNQLNVDMGVAFPNLCKSEDSEHIARDVQDNEYYGPMSGREMGVDEGSFSWREDGGGTDSLFTAEQSRSMQQLLQSSGMYNPQAGDGQGNTLSAMDMGNTEVSTADKGRYGADYGSVKSQTAGAATRKSPWKHSANSGVMSHRSRTAFARPSSRRSSAAATTGSSTATANSSLPGALHGSLMKTLRGQYQSMRNAQGNYKCPFCNSAYKFSETLTSHLERIHFGRSYPCEFCGTVFTTVQGLSSHKKTKHRDKLPYSCNLCGEVFNSSSAYGQHHHRRHGGQPMVENKVL